MTEVQVTIEQRLKPNNPNVCFVNDNQGLRAAIVSLANGSGPFAIDAERASGFKYSQRAYLIQVTRDGSPIFLVDPIPFDGSNDAVFEEFAQLLGTDEWILHAATQDLPCLKELGLKPKSIFDTELAGRLLGEPRVGLSALCESWLATSLAKEHSAVDWSTRPLHDDWLNYAALDVDVLIELRSQALIRLIRENKAIWAEQEFENLKAFIPKPPKPDKWRSMSGIHDLKSQRELAIARELWLARENLAVKIDVSPGRLVPDASIVAAAKEMPKSKSALAGLKSFVGRASRTYLDTWWAAISSGVSTNDLPELKVQTTGIPNHRNWETRFPEAFHRLALAKEEITNLAEELKLPVENLLQPDFLRQLCWDPPQPISRESVRQFLASRGARDWQIDLISPGLVQALTKEGSTQIQ